MFTIISGDKDARQELAAYFAAEDAQGGATILSDIVLPVDWSDWDGSWPDLPQISVVITDPVSKWSEWFRQGEFARETRRANHHAYMCVEDAREIDIRLRRLVDIRIACQMITKITAGRTDKYIRAMMENVRNGSKNKLLLSLDWRDKITVQGRSSKIAAMVADSFRIGTDSPTTITRRQPSRRVIQVKPKIIKPYRRRFDFGDG